jgi:hypothetical protein
MAGKKRPGPAPTGKRVEKVSVALRPEDVEVLKMLSLERFFVTTGKLGPVEAHRMIFEGGERPSVSAAIRYLIDAERERRGSRILAAWKKEHPKKPAPSVDELLGGDFVFGKRS